MGKYFFEALKPSEQSKLHDSDYFHCFIILFPSYSESDGLLRKYYCFTIIVQLITTYYFWANTISVSEVPHLKTNGKKWTMEKNGFT